MLGKEKREKKTCKTYKVHTAEQSRGRSSSLESSIDSSRPHLSGADPYKQVRTVNLKMLLDDSRNLNKLVAVIRDC